MKKHASFLIILFVSHFCLGQKVVDVQPGKSTGAIYLWNEVENSNANHNFPGTKIAGVNNLLSSSYNFFSYSSMAGIRNTITSTGTIAAIGSHNYAKSNNTYNYLESDLIGATGVYGEALSNEYAFGMKGIAKQNTTGDGIYYGVYGSARSQGTNARNRGIYGHTTNTNSTSFAGYFDGNVHINGTLSKSSGSFKIDHPLDPKNKYLSHSFVESPEMMNIYNGNVTTGADGKVTVKLPAYFKALNVDYRYQLTVIGSFAQAIILKEIEGNEFVVATDKPNTKVSWQVTGVRNDAYAQKHRIIPEERKPVTERGQYLNPDSFGVSSKRANNETKFQAVKRK